MGEARQPPRRRAAGAIAGSNPGGILDFRSAICDFRLKRNWFEFVLTTTRRRKKGLLAFLFQHEGSKTRSLQEDNHPASTPGGSQSRLQFPLATDEHRFARIIRTRSVAPNGFCDAMAASGGFDSSPICHSLSQVPFRRLVMRRTFTIPGPFSAVEDLLHGDSIIPMERTAVVLDRQAQQDAIRSTASPASMRR